MKIIAKSNLLKYLKEKLSLKKELLIKKKYSTWTNFLKKLMTHSPSNHKAILITFNLKHLN